MRKITFLIFLIFSSTTSFGQINSAEIFDSIQNQTQWKPAREARHYDPRTLSNFPSDMDQTRLLNATIFNEYGFTRLDSQDFQQKGKMITVEIYEMIDPTAAYGVFTFFRSQTSLPLEGIGNLGEEQESKIAYVQNKYYVKLSSPSRSLGVRSGLTEIGRIISKALPRSFTTPTLINRLPKENLVPHSDVFILGFRALNQKHRFGDKDLFGLANGAEMVIAKYQYPDDSATLLLLSYPTQQLAKKFLEKGYQEYSNQNPNQSIFFKREGPLVVLVLGSKSAEIATTLLDQVSYVSTVSWDPKSQPLSVGQMMINIFTYVGVMLGLALGVGIFFGLIRIILKRAFPGRIFDRPENLEIIRLNLSNPKDRWERSELKPR